jgi:hypothetical protein
VRALWTFLGNRSSPFVFLWRLTIMRLGRDAHHSTLTLEPLEDRTLLAGNLLLTAQVPGESAYNLMQYSQQGALVSSLPIPQVPGSTDFLDARGLSVDPSGNVDLYEDTFSPSLATLSAATGTWSYQTLSGWSTVNNISYGEVAAYKNFVFASDMATANSGAPNGIVRFDTSGGTAPVRFGQGTDYIQVSLGLDGQLYGLSGNGHVSVFNPDTLAPVRSFSLTNGPDSDIRGIAVDLSGQVFAASWGGYIASYNSSGQYQTSIQAPGPFGFGENLLDIALDKDGQIAVGGRNGEIFLTDESLASLTTIQTNQWNVFVTFDHYIGTGPQIVTPSFDSLASPTITYGQSSVTLGGRISAGTAFPSGSVNITVNGVTESAVINPNDGTFAAAFDTSTLGVSGSPYQITYSYPGDSTDTAIQDTSKSLTVLPAVTTLSSLSSPTVIVGTPTVTLSGVVGSNSVLPVGQAITVQVLGTNGPVASGSGTVGNDGSFSITLNTSALPVGSYTIQYEYAGDANFAMSQGSGTLMVSYAINLLYDTSNPVHPPAALRVKIEVTDASGNNLSSANLTVTAIALVDANGNTSTPHSKRNANPDNVFRQVGHHDLYVLDTNGLTAGNYTLLVQVGDDPVLHALPFVVA